MLPHLAEFKGFDPADPLEVMAARSGIPEKSIIRLNANENPYGPSPKVLETLSAINPHIYPDPEQRNVRRALAGFTGFTPDHIIVGAGSDEIIDLLFRLTVGKGDSIIECSPTFGMYGFGARLANAVTKSIPRDSRFEIDIDSTLGAVDSTTKIIFINSPNNPTGNIISSSHMESLLHTGLLVVVDEAYSEFAGQSFIDWVRDYENLVILRTFSKWAGIAGLRVGYGVMNPNLSRYLLAIKQPYNITLAAEAALIASLEDSEHLMERVKLIVKERRRMFFLLQEINGIDPMPSHGNYILCEFADGKASEVYQGLTSKGIFLRLFGHNRLRNYIRTSVGTPEQTDALITALHDLI